MKEGSALFAALLVAAAIAYWSDHSRLNRWGSAEPRVEPPLAVEPATHGAATPEPPAPLATEQLNVPAEVDAVSKAGVCAELLEVILGVDAALHNPQSPGTIEQLTSRRRAYQAKRTALGC